MQNALTEKKNIGIIKSNSKTETPFPMQSHRAKPVPSPVQRYNESISRRLVCDSTTCSTPSFRAMASVLRITVQKLRYNLLVSYYCSENKGRLEWILTW